MKKTFSEDEYFNSLKIESEDDLFNDIDGIKFYNYITQSEINDISEETNHICRVARFTIEELKWNIKNKRAGTDRYRDIYKLFLEHLGYYLEKLKECHKSIYVSIYKLYEDDIMDMYEKELKSLFCEFQNIEVHKNEDRIWNLVDIIFPKIDNSIIDDKYEDKDQDSIANFYYECFNNSSLKFEYMATQP